MIMLSRTPPMGWNSWNTFGPDINEKIVKDTADAMVELGYLRAGYEYVVIDDCWSLTERNEDGDLVADPEKFPGGMKALADYVHSKGLKFGIYSCAGVRTCAGYPGSFEHEYRDARLFASWGVDFLKYDFCNFPRSADCKNRYRTMALALRSSGRDILFSACNWGVKESASWMRGIGAHMFRSGGDIYDCWESMKGIMLCQMEQFNGNAAGCFNDLDMLTVGMLGRGNVGQDNCCTQAEYDAQFAFWCLCGSPLMMGADITNMDEVNRNLLLNAELIKINQDAECRPACAINPTRVEFDPLIIVRLLDGGDIAIGLFNFTDVSKTAECIFTDLGIPCSAGYALRLTDLFSGEEILRREDIRTTVDAHSCKVFRAKLVRV
jgi:alpha-galactosidase